MALPGYLTSQLCPSADHEELVAITAMVFFYLYTSASYCEDCPVEARLLSCAQCLRKDSTRLHDLFLLYNIKPFQVPTH